MEYKYVGKSVPKVDSREKVVGKAVYLDDIILHGMLYGKILGSIYPHALIKNIDVSKAESLPGVKAVITGKDLPDSLYGPFIKDEPVLAKDRVRYIGEPVAAVAATELEISEEALGLIDVEYEELPALFDPIEAMKPDAPIIHPDLKNYICPWDAVQEGNICSHTTFTDGDVEKGFQEADVIVEDTFTTPAQNQAYIEYAGAIAQMEPSGRFTVWTNTQAIYVTQSRISESLLIPMSKIRVISPVVGGGFGGKIETTVAPHALELARRAGKPVKIVRTREEEFITGRPRHPAISTVKLGVKKDGKIVAKQVSTVFDSGAYSCDGPGVTGFGTLMARGPYRVPNYRMDGYCVYTNIVKGGAFRGFGNTQTGFASESVMDMAAKEIGMDPVEFRRINAIEPGDKSVGEQVLKSVGIKECIDRATEAIGWKDEKENKYRGRGIALVNHISGLLTVSAIVKLNEDGTVNIQCGAMDIGQGSNTILCQICAEELGVPMEEVAIYSGDTDGTPYSWATSASRLTYTAGNSVKRASQDLKNQMLDLAAKTLEANVDDLEMKDKKIYVKGSQDKGLTFEELGAISCWGTGGQLMGKESFFVEDPPFDRSKFVGFPFGTMTAYIFAAQAVEVEVDVETGVVRVLKAVAAHDVGKAINPSNVEGQIEGGFVQGLGFALTEDTIFEKGKIMNPTFTDYKILPAADIPDLKVIIVEANDDTGPFGAKGVAEPCLVGVSPAVANAIYDAIGLRFTDLPITPEKVLKALKAKSA